MKRYTASSGRSSQFRFRLFVPGSHAFGQRVAHKRRKEAAVIKHLLNHVSGEENFILGA